MKKQVIILASSIKHDGLCVAGRVLGSGKWIRLVGDQLGAELKKEQALISNKYGTFGVKPMQIVEVDLKQHVPLMHQPENCLVHEGIWQQQYKILASQLPAYSDTPENLWGTSNLVAHGDISSGKLEIKQSLYLIHADEIQFSSDNNKKRITFEYSGVEYNLPSTDPNFFALKSGDMKHHGYVCVSLGEIYNENHYKIAAAIL